MPTTTQKVMYYAYDSRSKESSFKYFCRLIKRTSKDDIERCISLLEHVASCWDVAACQEGGGCSRTKQVILHYQTCCVTRENQECSICQQVFILCDLHAQRCQNHELGCNVLHCPNRKKSVQSREKCKKMLGKMMIAMRLLSRDERLRQINQLFMDDLQTAKRVLTELSKMKRARRTPRAVNQNFTRGITTSESLITWKANILFTPK